VDACIPFRKTYLVLGKTFYSNTEPQVIVNPDFQIKLTHEWDLNGRHLLA